VAERVFPDATRLRRWLPVIALAAATGTMLLSLRTMQTSAQGSTINIRPSASASGATIGNPQNAYDTNDSTTAGSAVAHVCYSECTTTTTKTATWLGVPAGYHPIRLEVHWQGAAAVALYGGDTSRVEVKLEYSLNGGTSWSSTFGSESADYIWTGASPACASNSITCTTHVSTQTLTDYQHTDQIQVRATLSVQLPHCDNCTLRVSNNSGQIWIYDIRVVVDDCQIPIAESSATVGWNTSYPLRTTLNFLQTLTPAGANNFSGRTVVEADGGDTTDTCHYSGDGVPDEVTEITSGGSWTVASNNTWGNDTIGWGEDAVTFYQASSQAKPCYATGSQQMFISCPNTYVPYIKNTLRYEIDTNSVSSQRQSTSLSKPWP
jgi:hypothetical protein